MGSSFGLFVKWGQFPLRPASASACVLAQLAERAEDFQALARSITDSFLSCVAAYRLSTESDDGLSRGANPGVGCILPIRGIPSFRSSVGAASGYSEVSAKCRISSICMSRPGHFGGSLAALSKRSGSRRIAIRLICPSASARRAIIVPVRAGNACTICVVSATNDLLCKSTAGFALVSDWACSAIASVGPAISDGNDPPCGWFCDSPTFPDRLTERHLGGWN